MSALDDLIEDYAKAAYNAGNIWSEFRWTNLEEKERAEWRAAVKEEIDAVLAEHAHELAEKIRQELPDPNPLASIFQKDRAALAADLIDPEMTKP